MVVVALPSACEYIPVEIDIYPSACEKLADDVTSRPSAWDAIPVAKELEPSECEKEPDDVVQRPSACEKLPIAKLQFAPFVNEPVINWLPLKLLDPVIAYDAVVELRTKLETARKMHEKGFSKTEILDISGHSESQLKEIGIV